MRTLQQTIEVPESEFKFYCEQLVALLKSEGINKIPYNDPALPIFKSLENSQKINSLEQLKFYIDSLNDVIQLGDTLSNNATSLWAAFKKLHVKPPSSFFSYLQEDDCIELYDSNHIQIWRNLNMMRVMTHTIEQVFCVPWMERYHRDPVALGECLKHVTSLLTQKTPEVLSVDVKNFVDEKDSSEMLILDVVHKYISPVTNEKGEICGYLAGSNVQVVGSKKQTKNTFVLQDLQP